MPERVAKPWSAEDEAKLRQIAARGGSLFSVADELGRSLGDVRRKAAELDLNLA